MLDLTEQQLQDLNTYFSWQTGIKLPDNRILGNQNVIKNKGKDIHLLEDAFGVEYINKCTICEFGCAEGFNTIELAKIAKEVITTDVRPRNLIGAMIRSWILNLNNIDFILADLNKSDVNMFILDIKDIVFHTGTLYHLIDPIKHLKYISTITHNLFLSTRCYDEQSEIKMLDAEVTGYGQFKQYRIYEKSNNWNKSFAGIEPYSIWLHKDDIVDILKYVGFANVELLYESRSYCPKVIYKATK